MANKWLALIKQLGVKVKSRLTPYKEKDINNFEENFGIMLPSEYKSFCQVFGSLYFGDAVLIECPNIDDSVEEKRGFFRDVLWSQREDFTDWESSRQQAYESICDLVEYAYFFGSTSVGLFFCFDLRTYASDESCDIYIISLVRDFGIECLGRDFFVFISEYCLGTKFYDSLPEEMRLFEPYELCIKGIG